MIETDSSSHGKKRFNHHLLLSDLFIFNTNSPNILRLSRCGDREFSANNVRIKHSLCYFTMKADVIPRGALIYFLFGLNALIPLANLESQLPRTSESPPGLSWWCVGHCARIWHHWRSRYRAHLKGSLPLCTERPWKSQLGTKRPVTSH